jgi:hypothetical protein
MIATYPEALPGPQPGAYELPNRRAASSLPGPLQQRSRQYDLSGGIRTQTFIYTAPQMAAWREWYRDTLLQGRRWFKLSLPGYGGMTLRTVRYLEHSQSLIGVGVYAIEARLELREANAVEPYVPPVQESSIVFKTQTAIAGNGGLSAAGEFPWPGTSSDGDLGVLVVFAEPGRTITATAGWTQIDTFVCSSGSAGARCTTFAREKVSGDTGVVASIDGGNGFIQGQFFVYENQRPGDYFDNANGLTNQPSASPIDFPNTAVEFVNVEILLIAVKAATSWPWFALATYTPGNLTGSTTAANTGWSAGARVAGNAIARARLGTEQATGAVDASASAPGIYSTRVIALR